MMVSAPEDQLDHERHMEDEHLQRCPICGDLCRWNLCVDCITLFGPTILEHGWGCGRGSRL